jgi:hypothetical protein
MNIELSPNETNMSNTNNNKDIIKKKIIIKFLVRFYFFINHKLKLSQDKQGESSKYSQATKDEIVKRFFEEDSSKLNRLANSVDMLLIKPYFKKLCDDSYDNDCNSYRKYLNMQLKEGQSADIISQNIIDAVKGYSEKFNAMSLNDQFIEKIRKLLSGTKSQISSRDFETISKSISGILKQAGLQDFENEVENLDKKKHEIKLSYDKKIKELTNEIGDDDNPSKETKNINDKEEIIQTIKEEKEEKVKQKNDLEEKKNAINDPEEQASLSFQINQLDSEIEEKNKKITEEQSNLTYLKEKKRNNDEERTDKIVKLKTLKTNNTKEIEEKQDEKYRKQGPAFFEKILKTSHDLFKDLSKEKIKEYITNPENFFKNEFQKIKINEDFKKKINLNELKYTLEYLKTTISDTSNKQEIQNKIEEIDNIITETKTGETSKPSEKINLVQRDKLKQEIIAYRQNLKFNKNKLFNEIIKIIKEVTDKIDFKKYYDIDLDVEHIINLNNNDHDENFFYSNYFNKLQNPEGVEEGVEEGALIEGTSSNYEKYNKIKELIDYYKSKNTDLNTKINNIENQLRENEYEVHLLDEEKIQRNVILNTIDSVTHLNELVDIIVGFEESQIEELTEDNKNLIKTKFNKLFEKFKKQFHEKFNKNFKIDNDKITLQNLKKFIESIKDFINDYIIITKIYDYNNYKKLKSINISINKDFDFFKELYSLIENKIIYNNISDDEINIKQEVLDKLIFFNDINTFFSHYKSYTQLEIKDELNNNELLKNNFNNLFKSIFNINKTFTSNDIADFLFEYNNSDIKKLNTYIQHLETNKAFIMVLLNNIITYNLSINNIEILFDTIVNDINFDDEDVNDKIITLFRRELYKEPKVLVKIIDRSDNTQSNQNKDKIQVNGNIIHLKDTNCNIDDNFGPFTTISVPEYNNTTNPTNPKNPTNIKTIENILNTTHQEYNFIDNILKYNKNVKMFGYGFSGSGKTYTLIDGDNNISDVNNNTDFSILAIVIQKLKEKKINLKITTRLFYPEKDYDMTDENYFYKQEFNSEVNLPPISLIDEIDKITRIYQHKINSIPSNNNSQIFIETKNFFKEIQNLQINFSYICPTTNNPESSRAFTIIKIKPKTANSGSFEIIDLPGLEKKVDIIYDFLFNGNTNVDYILHEQKEKIVHIENFITNESPIILAYDSNNTNDKTTKYTSNTIKKLIDINNIETKGLQIISNIKYSVFFNNFDYLFDKENKNNYKNLNKYLFAINSNNYSENFFIDFFIDTDNNYEDSQLLYKINNKLNSKLEDNSRKHSLKFIIFDNTNKTNKGLLNNMLYEDYNHFYKNFLKINQEDSLEKIKIIIKELFYMIYKLPHVKLYGNYFSIYDSNIQSTLKNTKQQQIDLKNAFDKKYIFSMTPNAIIDYFDKEIVNLILYKNFTCDLLYNYSYNIQLNNEYNDFKYIYYNFTTQFLENSIYKKDNLFSNDILTNEDYNLEYNFNNIFNIKFANRNNIYNINKNSKDIYLNVDSVTNLISQDLNGTRCYKIPALNCLIILFKIIDKNENDLKANIKNDDSFKKYYMESKFLEEKLVLENINNIYKTFFILKYIKFLNNQGKKIVSSLEHVLFEFLVHKPNGIKHYNKNYNDTPFLYKDNTPLKDKDEIKKQLLDNSSDQTNKRLFSQYYSSEYSNYYSNYAKLSSHSNMVEFIERKYSKSLNNFLDLTNDKTDLTCIVTIKLAETIEDSIKRCNAAKDSLNFASQILGINNKNNNNEFFNINILDGTDNTITTSGGSNNKNIIKKKRIKTIKKYRYIKNKTGKKRKKYEKIKIIKKNKNKMKITKAIIEHL